MLFFVLVFSWEFLNLYFLGILVFDSSQYLVISLYLSGFVIKVLLASLDEFGEIPLFTLFLLVCLFCLLICFWNSLKLCLNSLFNSLAKFTSENIWSQQLGSLHRTNVGPLYVCDRCIAWSVCKASSSRPGSVPGA